MPDEELARRVENMKAGRRRWLADLKARGEKVPCGRKPRNYAPPSERAALDHKADAAAIKRREGPYRRIMKEAEAEALGRAEQERGQAEFQHIAEENRLRSDPTVVLPDETHEEHLARVACIAERARRERARPLWERIEGKAWEAGFYRGEPMRFSSRTLGR